MSTAATITDTLLGLERDDALALLEELEMLPADAAALVTDAGDQPVQITDDDGDALTAAQAIADIDARLARLAA